MKLQTHMSISVPGLLARTDKELRGLFNKPSSIVRAFLKRKLEEGYKVIPMNGVECPGFDKEHGCPGHELQDDDGAVSVNPS